MRLTRDLKKKKICPKSFVAGSMSARRRKGPQSPSKKDEGDESDDEPISPIESDASKELELLRNEVADLRNTLRDVVEMRKPPIVEQKVEEPPVQQPIRVGWKFMLIRNVMVFVVFLFLHWIFQTLVFNPIFRPQHNPQPSVLKVQKFRD